MLRRANNITEALKKEGGLMGGRSVGLLDNGGGAGAALMAF